MRPHFQNNQDWWWGSKGRAPVALSSNSRSTKQKNSTHRFQQEWNLASCHRFNATVSVLCQSKPCSLCFLSLLDHEMFYTVRTDHQELISMQTFASNPSPSSLCALQSWCGHPHFLAMNSHLPLKFSPFSAMAYGITNGTSIFFCGQRNKVAL
jgi:hypothetical protein